MSILVISPNYPPEIGACASRIQYLCEAFYLKGHDVYVLTGFPSYPKGEIYHGYKNAFFAAETQNQVNVWRHGTLTTKSNNLFLRFFSQIIFAFSIWQSFFRCKQIGVKKVIVQSPPLILALSAVFFAKLLQVDLILNVSDLYPRVLLDLAVVKKNFFYRFLEKIEGFIYLKSKFIICQSNEILNYIAAIYPEKKLFLYRNGVQMANFIAENHEITAKKGNKIIYAGLLGFSQNILGLCENISFGALGFEFHIFGDGIERANIQKLIKDNPEKNIFLHPQVSHEKIPTLLSQFDIAIIPMKSSILGTVPSKLYEAMAAKLLILHLGNGEAAEFSKDFAFSCKPNDYKSVEILLKSIQNLSEDEKEKHTQLAFDLAKTVDKADIFEKFYAYFQQFA